MAGDREAGGAAQAHVGRTEPSVDVAPASAGASIAAVASAVSAGPAQVAAVLRRFPGQRAPLLTWLQANCGIAFVQSVIAAPPPGEAAAAWDLIATPHRVQFPETEVGAVSPPRTITLINRGSVALELASLELVPNGGTGEAAHAGEFELIDGQPTTLGPLQTMAVQVVFRPSRVTPHIGAHLRGKGSAAHQQVEVELKASAAPPRAEHADQRELSVAEYEARGLEVAAPSSVQHYGDMLAAVLAARTLTNRAKPGETAANPQIAKLLDPVARRLNELNDHQGRFAEFGAGNIAGQAALDMSESAIQRWLQLAALGGMIQSDELVTKFRVGAEPIRFLTGERGDAPSLRGFGQASRTVAVGSAALALGPALVALAVEEAALLGFAAQLGSRQVAVWALANPAAALAASEALLGFGVQIGEDGLGTFWDQLHDPQGCFFVVAQILMDFMHVRMSMSQHGEAPDGGRSARTRAEPEGAQARAPDLDAARQQVAKARAIVQRVHDAATDGHEPGGSPHAVDGDSPQREHVSTHEETASGDRTTTTDAAVDGARGPLGKADSAGLLLKEIERNAGGLRRPALDAIEPTEMERLKKEFADLGGDPAMLRFNRGDQTGYLDDDNIIMVRGDVNPVEDSLHPRSAMSSKATLGHELGHSTYRGTKLPVGAWNDEFRASYWAAKNLANLSDQDRIHLVLDAMERAKEAGVTISVNAFMRKVLYGY